MKTPFTPAGDPIPGFLSSATLPARQIPFDPLYAQARQILLVNPSIKKNALGKMLGIPGRSARTRIARFRGETEGHSLHPDYTRVRACLEGHPGWGSPRIAQHLRLTVECVRLQTARWIGATASGNYESQPPVKIVETTHPITEQPSQEVEDLITQLQEAAPVPPAIVRAPGRRGMLEICINDLHLGKHCWEGETGRAYNPEIAESMFWSALEDLLDRASAYRPEKILFVAGNDFFNVDNMHGTTTAGTLQNESSRWQQSFLAGQKLMIHAIDRMRQVAPVQVLVVPGNHDTQRFWYLGEVLAAWYRNTPDVEIDHGCRARKYVRYGRNLIGFCHGHAERHDDLPGIMALERASDWGQVRFREWHLGHFHAKSTKVFHLHREVQAVLIRTLPSLSPPDAWHSAMGFKSNLAAEAYFWDPQHGCVATFTHHPDNE